MIWRDIIFNKNINRKQLTSAFATVFDIEANKVSLIEDIEDFESYFLLTCIITQLPGDFCFCLDGYPNFKIENERDIISHLCKILDCQALITNDEGEDIHNSYAFILFTPYNSAKKVIVDDELYDNNNEIKIVSEY